MAKVRKKKMDAEPANEELRMRAAKSYAEANDNFSEDEPELDISGEVMDDEELLAQENEQIQALEKELAAARAKTAEYFEGWQRERADFLNYKKRIERDQASLSQNITGSLIKKYLVVMDDMERAMKVLASNTECASFLEGVELIYRKLQNILESEGLQRIPAESEMFNPMRHEALSNEDNPDYESGQVIEVIQQGYMLGERVLRPALVRVAQ